MSAVRHSTVMRRAASGGWMAAALLWAGFFSGNCRVLAQAHPEAATVLVVYNKTEPRSEAVARHYAARRGVPEKNLCALECPNREEITRAEFNNTILKPIRHFVQERGLLHYTGLPRAEGGGRRLAATLSRLQYVVLCYGVPLKIAPDFHPVIPPEMKNLRAEFKIDAAAVDSELAVLPLPDQPTLSFVPNPLYKKTFAQTPGWNQRLLCVTRLDGPGAEIAQRLVDDAMEAERVGLHGRGFFDLRGIADRNHSYKLGDDWIRAAANLFEATGWEVVVDEKEAVFGEAVDATSCAVYTGWYANGLTGPFRAPGFLFCRGAIAYHLHSLSASTLRSTTAGWTGPLIARGAAASLGCVYEPYLRMTPNPDIFFQRLLQGASFGEAAYACQEGLSWMATVVGDPLYRPFLIAREDRIDDLEGRFDRLDDAEKEALAWGWRTKARQMFLDGRRDEAIELTGAQAARLQQRALWVGLANLHLFKGEDERAAVALKAAMACAAEGSAQQGTLKLAARTCARVRDWDSALDFYRTLLTRHPRILDYQALRAEAAAAARTAGRGTEADFFENLKQPPPAAPEK